MLRLLLFVLPLGIDTLGVSISLGIKSQPHDKSGVYRSFDQLQEVGARVEESGWVGLYGRPLCPRNVFPAWLGSALLFSLAETVMPLVGLTIGYAVSLFVSSVMHILGPLLLIGVGLWELLEEVHERSSSPPIYRGGLLYRGRGKEHKNLTGANAAVPSDPQGDRKGRPYHTTAKPSDSSYSRDDPCGRPVQRLGRQLLLALSVSVDELAIGFSLGAITSGLAGSQTINTITLCILIGLQGFLMTFIGLTLGRTLRVRLKFVKQWTELLSCFLLIALGVWLLIT